MKLNHSALLLSAVAVLLPVVAMAQAVRVDGYYRRDGTYVQPHYRSAPDGNSFNNFSTYGNVNPYTGQMGHVQPYANQPMVGTRNMRSQFPAAKTPSLGTLGGSYDPSMGYDRQ